MSCCFLGVVVWRSCIGYDERGLGLDDLFL